MEILASHGDSVPTTTARWQQLMRSAYRDVADLCDQLGIDPPHDALDDNGGANQNRQAFRLFAPQGYVDRMRPGDANDPLLLQILPSREEQRSEDGFLRDPVGDLASQQTGGTLHKYRGRALLVTTGACGIHCRYCFRQNFPYRDFTGSHRAWDRVLEAIATDDSLFEVILSGGDPWTLDNNTLSDLISRLAAIDHLRLVRVHSRMPVVIPERVDRPLLNGLTSTRLTPVVVIHANHPQELDGSVAMAVERMRSANITVLNQSVLLKRINDDVDTLMQLSLRLVEMGVLPYYLHQLDRVHGSARFEVPVDRGIHLVRELVARLPRYAVPRFVQEVPGAPAKELIEA